MILVTGGLGMIGAHTAEALLDPGHRHGITGTVHLAAPFYPLPAFADFVGWLADNPR